MELTEANQKRKVEIVNDYAEKHNWSAIARIIGGNPREDLQDYIPGKDDGEPPHGAVWE